MQDNHYAPPKALVDDVGAAVEVAPPLWNPNAAASWSLLFTPVFGTILHWRNWSAMGETKHAAAAKTWLIAAVVVIIVLLVLIYAGLAARGTVRIANVVFLLTWYFAAAKPQAKAVAERFGEAYPRRGWLVPIAIALTAIIAAIAGITVLLLLFAR